ncbi:aldo/keto reductase [Algivirga pacifica]|uniref:Aldo/keto reductase n=1 Tax=Algivirga pacifica TaxID=1162670 RepID=A0ABP9DEI7_9BACT
MYTLTFRNNDVMPALGLGTWKSEKGEVYDAVLAALEAGYRHLDCAFIYGNEKEIGEALTEAYKRGIVQRSDLWITSKLWNDSHAKGSVVPALQQTLNDLQTDYLDLYLIHWPVAHKKGVLSTSKAEEQIPLSELPISETWTGMEEAVRKGLTKHIGVCNFGLQRLKDLVAVSNIKPEMNQVESHPYLQQNELLEYCKANDIHYTGYSPLGSPDRPGDLRKEDDPILLEDNTINAIAKRHKVSPAQVTLAWALQRGTSVIPKSVNPERIKANLKANDLKLSEEDMAAIKALDKNRRYLDGSFWFLKGGTYKKEDLWK